MLESHDFTGKTSGDNHFSSYYTGYQEFDDPQLFSRQIKLPQDYLDRVSSFMMSGESGQLYGGKGGSRYNLPAEDERMLFVQFNYAKMKMANATSQSNFDKWETIAVTLRQTIMYANVFLVSAVCKTIKGWLPEAQDLCSEGCMGLMRAIHKFDVDLENKFSTYAFHSIRRSMLRYITRKQDRVGRVNKYNNEMIHQDQTFYDDKDTGESEQRSELHKAINSDVLDDRERKIINLRFPTNGNKPMTLKEVGDVFGLTKERARQIESKAIMLLRQHMIAKELD
jgi:RNA polymerase sigma factor (sigma-70 family)